MPSIVPVIPVTNSMTANMIIQVLELIDVNGRKIRLSLASGKSIA